MEKSFNKQPSESDENEKLKLENLISLQIEYLYVIKKLEKQIIKENERLYNLEKDGKMIEGATEQQQKNEIKEKLLLTEYSGLEESIRIQTLKTKEYEMRSLFSSQLKAFEMSTRQKEQLKKINTEREPLSDQQKQEESTENQNLKKTKNQKKKEKKQREAKAMKGRENEIEEEEEIKINRSAVESDTIQASLDEMNFISKSEKDTIPLGLSRKEAQISTQKKKINSQPNQILKGNEVNTLGNISKRLQILESENKDQKQINRDQKLTIEELNGRIEELEKDKINNAAEINKLRTIVDQQQTEINNNIKMTLKSSIIETVYDKCSMKLNAGQTWKVFYKASNNEKIQEFFKEVQNQLRATDKEWNYIKNEKMNRNQQSHYSVEQILNYEKLIMNDDFENDQIKAIFEKCLKCIRGEKGEEEEEKQFKIN